MWWWYYTWKVAKPVVTMSSTAKRLLGDDWWREGILDLQIRDDHKIPLLAGNSFGKTSRLVLRFIRYWTLLAIEKEVTSHSYYM